MGVYVSDENGRLKKYAGSTRLYGSTGTSNSGAMTQKAVTDELNKRANKVSGATTNNLASLDANGNIKDSGKNVNSFLSSTNFTYVEKNLATLFPNWFTGGVIRFWGKGSTVICDIFDLKFKTSRSTGNYDTFNLSNIIPSSMVPRGYLFNIIHSNDDYFFSQIVVTNYYNSFTNLSIWMWGKGNRTTNAYSGTLVWST